MRNMNTSKISFAEDLATDRWRNLSPTKNDAYEFFNLQKLKSELLLKVIFRVLLFDKLNIHNKFLFWLVILKKQVV